MANAYTSLFVHIIFSTKNRERVLITAIRDRLWAYMGGIARENRMKAISIGGMMDHTHLLLSIPANMPIAKAVQLIKGGSSKWLHENFSELQNVAWQEGYGAFSLGASQIDHASSYIARHVEHHRTKSFQEEYLGLLKDHGIQYDEKYVWG